MPSYNYVERGRVALDLIARLNREISKSNDVRSSP